MLKPPYLASYVYTPRLFIIGDYSTPSRLIIQRLPHFARLRTSVFAHSATASHFTYFPSVCHDLQYQPPLRFTTASVTHTAFPGRELHRLPPHMGFFLLLFSPSRCNLTSTWAGGSPSYLLLFFGLDIYTLA